ncbi:membrane-associated protease RseP (regulator of RpoE activity) [Amycolatopsis bartoniae]|uniref:Zn-dependent protease n=1 Tax=Amycolatopsis bartoniae TaxID=941986 RepID=A0A8H9IWS0_9PSEU|nr:site-2 protease family protein [Amycolatopsis bartoniae]MBB2935908.1 membrane-associated protease RseP (regulator of RpoE activity) [Amycolatopsis bartoniae]TVT02683.1 site-2 protease family protein [Amycolatopsis bartoniae]GHF62747.1 Zn-dependent protease [Amycolatopsis bartoniae]
MLAYIIGVVLFALGICVSVALHEAGHMVTAKAFGMKVRRYFIGFGPKVFSFRRGETEYGLKWIPLGGFCDIAGMTALDEVAPEEAPRAMWRFKTWKRTVVLAAGSVTHFILGFVVLYLMAVTMGLPNVTGTPQISAVSECVRNAQTDEEFAHPNCRPGDPAPAKQGGLQPGDKVLSVNGKSTPTYVDVTAAIQQLSGPVTFQVERDGRTVPLTIDVAQVQRPVQDEKGNEKIVTVGSLGVTFANNFSYNPVSAFGGAGGFTANMFVQTWDRLLEFPERIPAVVHSIFGGERDPNTPVSVVGASRIGGEAVENGLWQLFFLLLASLNFFVGVFNLLPLLPLDGGHIAVTWYERVRDGVRKMRGKAAGGPVDYTKLSAITMVLVFIGGAVTLLTVTADIVNPIRLQ